MNQEKILEYLERYGEKVCTIRLSNPRTRSKAYHAKETDYPLIAMGYIGQKIFSQENIDNLNLKDEYYTEKVERKDLINILNVLDNTIIKTDEQANLFIDGLLNNIYSAVNGFEIAFNETEKDSKLDISLIKS